jgi:enoyl-CoA hydratase/carnithine racemase
MSEQKPDDLVLHHIEDNVSYVTLNRPDKLNALSGELRVRAQQVLTEADSVEETRVVVLQGAGRAFCVGYDIGTESPDFPGDPHDALQWRDMLQLCLDFEMTPWRMRKPVIASVQGYALGAGCELAMLCDLTICSESAKFGEPEIRFSDTGPALIMPFIIGHKRAREMLYMGDMIDAQTALECDMVNRVVADDDLQSATKSYAQRLALIDQEALYSTKLALRRGMEASGVGTAINAGADVLAPMYAAKTKSGSKFEAITQRDGLAAALKWRRDQFKPLP